MGSGSGEELVNARRTPIEAEPERESGGQIVVNPSAAGKSRSSCARCGRIPARAADYTYLSTAEGYDVITLSNAAEAHHVLEQFTPALLIAEIEGEDLPGYEVCAHVKATPRLQTRPGDADDQLGLSERLLKRAFAGRGGLHREAFRQDRLGHACVARADAPGEAQAAPGVPETLRAKPAMATPRKHPATRRTFASCRSW